MNSFNPVATEALDRALTDTAERIDRATRAF